MIRKGKWNRHSQRDLIQWDLVPEGEYTAACLKLEPGDTLVPF